MIVLGIDPGLANTGYGVIARRGSRFAALENGVIQTPAHAPPEQRLATIRARLADTIRTHACEAMALEELYFGQNARSAFAVGHARGVAMLAAGEHGIPFFILYPRRLRSVRLRSWPGGQGAGRADGGGAAQPRLSPASPTTQRTPWPWRFATSIRSPFRRATTAATRPAGELVGG